MAKVTLKQFGNRRFGGAAGAYGNTTNFYFKLETAADGSAIGADSTDPIADADVVDLGPAGRDVAYPDASSP